MRKAQTTLFIIMGIILLLLVASALYLYNFGSLAAQGQQDSTVVRNYIESCLSDISRQGLLLLGSQGSHLYARQGGLSDDSTPSILHTMRQTEIYTAYAIQGTTEVLPEYPWYSFPYTPNRTNVVPGLPKSFTAEHGKEGVFGIAVLPELIEVRESFERYVERTIIPSNINSCINDFSGISDRYDVAPQQEPRVTVTFAAQDTEILLTYPLTVQKKGTEQDELFETFTVSFPVRYKAMHEFAEELVANDIDHITFDPVHFEPDAGSQSLFEVEKFENVSNYDDLFKITDELSSIENEPFELWFARKNRPPALMFMLTQFPVVYSSNGYTLTEGHIAPIIAFDPDEDERFTSSTLPLQITGANRNIVPTPLFTISVTDNEFTDTQGVLASVTIMPNYNP